MMVKKGKCYIYGSVHIKMPREDVLRVLLDKADYILIEGFDMRSWKSIVREKWSLFPVILGLLTYFAILGILIKIKGVWYKFIRKSSFKGDMEYVREYAKKMGKKIEIEVVDASLSEVFLKGLPELEESSRSCIKLIALLIVVSVFVFLCYWASYIVKVSDSRMVMLSCLTLILLLPIISPTICTAIFVKRINDFRDSKVVKRASELIGIGYSVLIVRGKTHVEFISNELQKHDIVCEIYDP